MQLEALNCYPGTTVRHARLENLGQGKNRRFIPWFYFHRTFFTHNIYTDWIYFS